MLSWLEITTKTDWTTWGVHPMAIFPGLPVGIMAHISRVFPVIHTADSFIRGQGRMVIILMIVAGQDNTSR